MNRSFFRFMTLIIVVLATQLSTLGNASARYATTNPGIQHLLATPFADSKSVRFAGTTNPSPDAPAEDTSEVWQNQAPDAPWGAYFGVDYFANDQLFVITQNGRTLRSADGGDHLVYTGTSSADYIISLMEIDPLTWVVVTDSGEFMRTSDGGTHWSLLFRDARATTVHHGNFFTHSFGCVVGDGVNFQTSDGGLTWKPLFATTAYLNDIWFLNADTAFAVGNSGYVVRTYDRFRTWEVLPSVTSETLWRVRFVDARHGFITSTMGGCLRTEDGGDHWLATPTGTTETLQGIVPVGHKRLFIFGASGGIYLSADSGKSWARTHTPTTMPIYAMAFENSLVGTAVGSRSTILHTTDGGNSWVTQGRPTDNVLFGVSFATPQLGAACGANGTILTTTDAGRHWVNRTTGLWDDLVHVAATQSGYTVASTTSGTIIESPDTGKTWHADSAFEHPIRTLTAIDETHVLGAGDSGYVVRLGIDGKVTSFHLGDSLTFTLASFSSPKFGYVISSTGRVWSSTDSGTSWHSLPYTFSSASPVRILDAARACEVVHYSDVCWSTHGMGVWADYSSLRITTNHGQTWVAKTSIANSTLDLSFPDSSTIVAVGHRRDLDFCRNDVCILISRDSGTTWNYAHPLPSNNINAVCASDANNITAVGENGTIMRLMRGGTVPNPSISYSPRYLTFARTPIGAAPCDTVIMHNGSNAQINVKLTNISSDLFSVFPPALSVRAGDSATVLVTFRPRDTSQQVAFAVFVDDLFGNSDTLFFEGAGSAGPALAINRRNIFFGEPAIGASAADSIELTNIGTADLSIDSIAISDPHFSLATSIVTRLAFGATTFVPVVFHSDSIRNYSAQLFINSNSPTSPDTVDLSAATYNHVSTSPTMGADFSLQQNFPNPTSSTSTYLCFSLPTPGTVKVRVYTVLGEPITWLDLGQLPAGQHAKPLNLTTFPPGVYFYRVESSGQALTRKMVIQH